jgi:hypothetical protein
VLIILLCVIIVAASGGCWIKGLNADSDVAHWRSLSQSNSVAVEIYKAQAGDANSKFSQQSVENVKLNAENNSLKQRLTYFETLPNGVLILASNLVAFQSNGIGNPEVLRKELATLISELMEKQQRNPVPTFELSANYAAERITNHAVLFPDNERNITFAAKNLGVISVNGLTIQLHIQTWETNISGGTDWRPMPSTTVAVSGKTVPMPNSCAFVSIADHPTALGGTYLTSQLHFSTNIVASSVYGYIGVYSENSGLQVYELTFQFK